ncbi:putative DNA primase large subunit [Raphanus sativus]|nr:putative DNA primase large subunit [Raphanus sativus]
MEVIRSQKKRTGSNDAVSNPKIPLYLTAPQMEIRLEEFVLFAIDRLRVLKGVSDGLARGRNHKEMDEVVDALWKEHMRHYSEMLNNKDIISHFVLRLVYCRSERLWESLDYRIRQSQEQSLRLGQVVRSLGQISHSVEAVYYKIVEALSTTYVGPDYSQSSEYADVSLKDIDQVAKSSFPFHFLREDHHLKHGGRMQLGLFLKGVGLKLDDALAFWRTEFSKKVGSERFDKEYAYGIRHNYGKEGKRTDYTPYACQKIISSAPGAGDHHGCPYRHFSEDNLRAALGRMGLSSRGMEDVMDKVRNKHYQLACTLTFEAVYGTSCDTGINHPNQYFEESQKILKSKTPAAPVYSLSLVWLNAVVEYESKLETKVRCF